MASLIDELISTLEEEYDVYQRLIPVSEEKTKIIIQNDLTALQNITDKEQSVIDCITALEHRREEAVSNIKTVINWKSKELDLKSLINLLEKQPMERKKLSILHDNLQRTLNRLVEINKQNDMLIRQSLEMIEFSMNVIQSTRMSPGNNNYTKTASQYETQSFGTGMFDAKQ